MRNSLFIPVLVIGGFLLISTTGCQPEKTPDHPFQIKVTFKDSLYPENISGKLILLLDDDTSQILINGVNPVRPHPVFTYDIKNWNPDDTLIIHSFKDSWHKQFSELDGLYGARLFFDYDTVYRDAFRSKGNACSEKQVLHLTKDGWSDISFHVEHTFKGWVFHPAKGIEEVQYRSVSLSKFHGRDRTIQAAVVLPESYSADTTRKYPVVFVFPGFGSNHAAITYGDGQIRRYGMNRVGEDKIFVFCNGELENGYFHFVDSENNGPWGTAFTEEFLPFIENKYRCFKIAEKRFLMGQSSGAWTAAFMLIKNPDLFSAAFVASPDPLDFRAMGFNIYAEKANFYFPGNPDSIQTAKGNYIKQYAILEDVLGEYGQIKSWEASFSPKNKNGQPSPLFNRETGYVYPGIAEHWKQFDIAYQLKCNPDFYQNKLENKLYFFVSEDDPYNLAKSVHLLDEISKMHNIRMNFNYLEGMGHNVWNDEVRQKIHQIIDSK